MFTYNFYMNRVKKKINDLVHISSQTAEAHSS